TGARIVCSATFQKRSSSLYSSVGKPWPPRTASSLAVPERRPSPASRGDAPFGPWLSPAALMPRPPRSTSSTPAGDLQEHLLEIDFLERQLGDRDPLL